MLAAVVAGAGLAAVVVGVDGDVAASTVSGDAQPQARSAAATNTLTSTTTPKPTTSVDATSVPAADPTQALATAMGPLSANKTGDFSVAVLNQDTGVTAGFNAAETYDTASIVKADILAVLLYQAQQQGTPLTDDEDAAATKMIEASDNDAATTLWDDVGSAAGMATANTAFGLRNTVPGADDYWGLTTTTVADQLTLMNVLTSSKSLLRASARAYAANLMHQIEPDQVWGVSAAADAGTTPALKNGWLPVDSDNDLWAINSIGQVSHGGHTYVVAFLSSSQPDEQTGIDQASAVCKAAVAAVAGR
ncbi:serine hydrolase [Kutzneria sp. CA-103260]|uniref:serine hydrolase n=1 Tax=Kutzneria sp. CA-103260 TaxID=2802641 RepID=UPI001BABDE99|nr:serine hydrolase [Kutzneria sp. CA-103260]